MKFKNLINFFRFVRVASKNQRAANAVFDKRYPMNAYPPVYEADEQMRFNITLAIVGSGIGLITYALQDYSKSTAINGYALIYGGSIILFALLYLIGTATRLRYQNPGEAQLWYVSESGRRNAYDSMVEMFWNGLLFGLEFTIPFYLLFSNKHHLVGAFWAVIELLVVNGFIRLQISVGMENDRKTGNLQYNHNLKMKTAKEKREPFDAPPITHSQTK